MMRHPLRPADPLRWFDSAHVKSATLKLWMQLFHRTAQHMMEVLANTPNKELALQHLLQCKDATTRCVIETAEMYAEDEGQLLAPTPSHLSGILPPPPTPFRNEHPMRWAMAALESLAASMPHAEWKVAFPHDYPTQPFVLLGVVETSMCATTLTVAIHNLLSDPDIRLQRGKERGGAALRPLLPTPTQRPDIAGAWVRELLAAALTQHAQDELENAPPNQRRLTDAGAEAIREMLRT